MDYDENDEYEFMIPVTNLTRVGNFIDRYFVRFYRQYNIDGINNDHYIFQHTNKLIMIGLSYKHDIIVNKKKILKITFFNQENMEVKGKSKQGGLIVRPETKLGIIFCEDNCEYTIFGVIKGQLIEFNDNLIEEPQLIVSKNDSQGFIAIINIGKHIKLPVEKILRQSEY